MSGAHTIGAAAPAASDIDAIRALVGALPDPEIPVVTLADLGILRDVSIDARGPVVTLTPTYSGCPATEAIVAQVHEALAGAGYPDARVQIALAPAWTTDWIGDDARRKLRAYGIAPPACAASTCGGHGAAPSADSAPPQARSRTAFGTQAHVLRFQPRSSEPAPRCPRCDAADVQQLSAYGSTPCKALWRCGACGEPFDYFKPY